mmetsp:Transcript_12904/g.31903  ORF Transcript_12904/g.31903 Transcript_12904/m.31903 type:complete len:94 (+) Transcript_12904:72-353(+)
MGCCPRSRTTSLLDCSVNALGSVNTSDNHGLRLLVVLVYEYRRLLKARVIENSGCRDGQEFSGLVQVVDIEHTMKQLRDWTLHGESVDRFLAI